MRCDKKQINKTRVYFLCLVAVAFLLRLLPLYFIGTETEKVFLFLEPDAYYHLRRAMIIAHNFPRYVSLDYYMAYPNGAECPWPPLYDYFVALISLVAGGGKVVTNIFVGVNALLPVVAGTGCIFPVYGIAKALWEDKRVAYLASLLVIFVPYFYVKSSIIGGDHHAYETLLWLCFFYYGLLSLKDIATVFPTARTVVCGGLMALGMLLWQGQIFFYTIWFICINIFLYMYRNDAEVSYRLIRHTFITGVIGSVIHAFVRFLLPRGSELSLFSYGYFSYFQPIYVMLVVFATILFFLVISRAGSYRRFTRTKTITVLLLITLVLLFLVREEIRKAVIFLTVSDPWLTAIGEFQPLLFAIGFNDAKSISLHRCAILAIYLIPLFVSSAYFYKLLKSRDKYELNNRGNQMMKLFFYFTVLVLSILPHYQVRWLNAFAPFAAIIVAGFLYELILYMNNRRILVITPASKKFSFYFWGFGIIPIGIFLGSLNGLIFKSIYSISSDNYYAFLWLKENTPKTSFLWNPDKKPEYAVFAFWDQGHYIQYFAERPTIVNNFGHLIGKKIFEDSLKTWGFETEERVARFCNEHGIKYVLINVPPDYITTISGYTKIDFKRFVDLPMARMIEFDGSESRNGPALQHFRLIYESESTSLAIYHTRDVKESKIYEFVPGACLYGKIKPNSVVTVKARFRTNQQREFLWESKATSDSRGVFNIVVPYATRDNNYEVKALTPFEIRANGKIINMHVSGNEIISGKKILVPFFRNR